jgi:hypothetical protein
MTASAEAPRSGHGGFKFQKLSGVFGTFCIFKSLISNKNVSKSYNLGSVNRFVNLDKFYSKSFIITALIFG